MVTRVECAVEHMFVWLSHLSHRLGTSKGCSQARRAIRGNIGWVDLGITANAVLAHRASYTCTSLIPCKARSAICSIDWQEQLHIQVYFIAAQACNLCTTTACLWRIARSVCGSSMHAASNFNHQCSSQLAQAVPTHVHVRDHQEVQQMLRWCPWHFLCVQGCCFGRDSDKMMQIMGSPQVF